jgi:hypothetical protein
MRERSSGAAELDRHQVIFTVDSHGTALRNLRALVTGNYVEGRGTATDQPDT